MKKQFKKSLSLFMAVLMLMSCWVFVAPEKAEAATAGSYPLTIWARIDDVANNCSSKVTVKYKPNNGTGTQATATYNIDSFFNGSTTNQQSKEYKVADVPGFPTEITVSIETTSGCGNEVDIYLQTIIIGNVTITDIAKDNGIGHRFRWVASNGSDSATYKPGDSWVYTERWTTPAVSTLELNDADPASVNINQWGGANKTATVSVKSIKDQYGVAWYQDPTWKIGTSTSSFNGYTGVTNGAGTNAASSTTLTISPEAQKANQSTTTDTKTLHVQASCGGKTATKSITLKNPAYTWTYHTNNPKTDSAVTLTKSNNETLKSSALDETFTDANRYYYYYPGTYPKSGSKDGYVYKGMYSDKNVASYALNESDFKPTGTKFESTLHTVANGKDNPPLTYYAAWWAKTYDVTFAAEDGNGVLQKTVLKGKYDKTLDSSNTYNTLGNRVNVLDVVPTPEYHKRPGETGSFEFEFAGDWVVSYAEDASGKEITASVAGTSFNNYVIKGKTTFEPVFRIKGTNSYTVKFYGENKALLNSANSTFAYNTVLSDENTKVQLSGRTKAADNTYTYTFLGWHKFGDQNAAARGAYIVDENGFDENNEYISLADYKKVRDNASYAPVYKKTYINYTVSFTYYDKEKGKNVTVDYKEQHYGDPVNIPTPEEYTTNGYRYTPNGWLVNGSLVTVSPTVNGNRSYTASYKEEAAIYTINFYDYNGEPINKDNNQFSHGTSVIAPNATARYYDDENEYNWTKDWQTENGGTFETVAGADVDYYPVYDATKLYTVSYYNEDEFLYSAKEVAGRAIPDYKGETPTKDGDKYADVYTFSGWADENGEAQTTMPEGGINLYAQYDCEPTDYTVKFFSDDGTTELIPAQTLHFGDDVTLPTAEERAKAPDKTYNYKFVDWDKEVSATCQGDATYTAIYNKDYNYYHVVWQKEDGETIYKTDSYIYNERINTPVTTPPSEYSPSHWTNPITNQPYDDKEYTVVFDKWVLVNEDGTLGAGFVRGVRATDDIAYRATYKVSAAIYKVEFLNEDGTEKLQSIDAAYESHLKELPFSVPVKTSDAEEKGNHYNFLGWKDEDGNFIKFDFDKNTITIYNADGDVITTNGKNVFDGHYLIKGNCKFTAVYEEEEHSFTLLTKTEKEPTFFEKGKGTYTCKCGRDLDKEIPKLEDTVAPGATLYIKNKNWKNNETVDYNDPISVSPSNNFIITSIDNGVWSKLNLEGKGVGVATIEHSVQPVTRNEDKEVVVAEAKDFAENQWTTRFSYDEIKEIRYITAAVESGANAETLAEKLDETDDFTAAAVAAGADSVILDQKLAQVEEYLENIRANASGTFAKYAVYADGTELKTGDEFMVYVKATDRLGNAVYLNSGVLVYDNAVPAITVSNTEGRYQNRYCVNATVTVSDNYEIKSLVLSNGTNEKDVTDELKKNEDGSFSYTVTHAGIYQAIVTDPAGNRSTANFEVVKAHAYKTYTVAPTCTKDGKTFDRCTLCGKETNETPQKATGHAWSGWIKTAPTCVTNGYYTNVCTRCGQTDMDATGEKVFADKINAIEDEEAKAAYIAELKASLNALGHTWKETTRVNPTCSKEGYTVNVCEVCNTQKTPNDVLEIDTSTDAHSYYTAKDRIEPTCTVDGKIVETCKYCGNEHTVEVLTAPGHTASGEWVVTEAATCEGEGKTGTRVQYCAKCNTTEPVVTETIPIPEHTWRLDKIVEPTETEDGYSVYKCAVCGITEDREKVDKIVKYTVTFDVEGDKTEVEVLKGNSIVADDAPNTDKAADKTYNYTFKEWVDENGTAVKLPFTVEKDVTLKATYEKRNILYTISLLNDDGTLYRKIGYLENEKEVNLPKLTDYEDTTQKYIFKGWKLNGEEEATPTMTYTIDGADVTLIADYDHVTKEYTVVFAYDINNVIEKVNVEAGKTAALSEGVEVAVPAADAAGHYVFAGWSKSVENVQSDLYVTAVFEQKAHSNTIIGTSNADCTHAATTTYKCDNCGYVTVLANGEALGHNWSKEPVYNEQLGQSVYTCDRCDETKNDDRMFEVVFYARDTKGEEYKLKIINYLHYGQDITDLVPANVADFENEISTYKFVGWDKEIETVVTASAEYHANYDIVKKSFNVVYAIDSNHVLQASTVEAGSDIPAYTGAAINFRDFNNDGVDDYATSNVHYVFDKFVCNESTASGKVYKDLYFTAKFAPVDHSFVESIEKANCTKGERRTYTCECGLSYDVESSAPLGHKYEEKIDEYIAPTETTKGQRVYICSVCKDKKIETIPEIVQHYVTISVVCEEKGHEIALSGANVTVYDSRNTYVTSGKTVDGQITFKIEKEGKYTVIVDGADIDTVKREINVTSERIQSVKILVNATICSCSCHKNNFWGKLFRFFHKMIMLINGSHKCCANPDSRYYKK